MCIKARHVQAALALALLVVGAASAADRRLPDAARTQDAAAVKSLLKQGVAVNGTQPDGFTALHWAVQRHDLAMADALIRAGAAVKLGCDHRNYPAHVSIAPDTLASLAGDLKP